jgi:hypothetical protein
VLTTVLGFAMAAVSYALIESPCRNALRRWEYRRAGAGRPGDDSGRAVGRHPVPIPPLDSSVTDDPEPAVAH